MMTSSSFYFKFLMKVYIEYLNMVFTILLKDFFFLFNLSEIKNIKIARDKIKTKELRSNTKLPISELRKVFFFMERVLLGMSFRLLFSSKPRAALNPAKQVQNNSNLEPRIPQ